LGNLGKKSNGSAKRITLIPIVSNARYNFTKTTVVCAIAANSDSHELISKKHNGASAAFVGPAFD